MRKKSLTLLLLIIFTVPIIGGCGLMKTKDNKTEQTYTVWLDSMNISDGMTTLDTLKSSDISDKDQQQLSLLKMIYEKYHFCLSIGLEVHKGSEGNISINYYYLASYGKLMERFGNSTVKASNEIENRIIYLWLNDKIDEFYTCEDFTNASQSMAEELKSTYDIDHWNEFIESNNYQWMMEMSSLDEMASESSSENNSQNIKIGDILLENYYAYNTKLSSKLDPFYAVKNLKPELAKIYKENGDKVFGKNVDGSLVISDYDDMFGELDKTIMEDQNLTKDDFL